MRKKLFFLAFSISLFVATAQTVAWQQAYGGTDSDKAVKIIKTTDGNLVVAGHYKSTDGDFSANYGNYDIFVMKTDMSGTMIWRTVLGGTNVDYVTDIIETGNGDFILTGNSKSNDNDITGNHGNYDALVVKLDNSGTIVWQKSFGGSTTDKATSVVEMSNGNFIVLAYTKSTDGDVSASLGAYDVWLLKLDGSGNIVAQNSIGGSSDDKSHKIYVANNGKFMVTAYSKSGDGDVGHNEGNYDFWIVQINDDLSIAWSYTFGGSGIEKEPVLVDNSGTVENYILAGTSSSNDGDITNAKGSFDMCLINFDATGNIIWQNNIGGSDADFPTDIQRLENTFCGCFVVMGYSNSEDVDFPTNYDAYDAQVVTIDNTGNILFSKNYGGTDTDRFTSFIQIPDVAGGNPDVIATGTTKSNDNDVTGQHGNYDAWIMRINADQSSISDNNLMQITYYPNPVNQTLHIEADNIKQIQLMDLSGKILIDKKGEYNAFDLNVANISKGNYLIKIYTDEGIGIRKIIVN